MTITDTRKPGVVILGSTSSVMRAVAARFAAEGCNLVLAARDAEENARIAQDIHVRYGVGVAVMPLDALAFDDHGRFVSQCVETLGEGLEGVVLGIGHMTGQDEAARDVDAARMVIDVNYTAPVSLLNCFANHFEGRRKGFLAALSSVAGDRGRQSNYIYGSAKAGLNVYLQGLRNRLHPANVQVITLKPGFMDTKMTRGMKLPRALTASPEAAGRAIHRAIRRRRNTAYILWYWRPVMLVIRAVPECVFKRLKM